MMREVLRKLFAEGFLTRDEAANAMNILMEGKAPPEQVGAFLGFLKGKGESVEEIAGCAKTMRDHALALNINRTDLIDTCGTGGDGASTFNISTVNAFVMAGAGLGVVKHGNRSISSKCGSADVLETLGVKIDLPPDRVAHCVEETGFGFLFARLFHPSVKNVAGIRTSLGVRTVFNLLGPLTNPARATRQVIGVFDHTLLEKLAWVMKDLGSEEVMMVTGYDGLDEITITGKTHVSHLKDGKVRNYDISPEDAGLPIHSVEAIKGGDADCNSKIALSVLGGDKGAPRDIVVLNGAAGLLVAGKVQNLREGREMAEHIIDSGKAMAVLDKVREVQ